MVSFNTHSSVKPDSPCYESNNKIPFQPSASFIFPPQAPLSIVKQLNFTILLLTSSPTHPIGCLSTSESVICSTVTVLNWPGGNQRFLGNSPADSQMYIKSADGRLIRRIVKIYSSSHGNNNILLIHILQPSPALSSWNSNRNFSHPTKSA